MSDGPAWLDLGADWQTRRRAVSSLSAQGDAAVVPELVALVRSQHQDFGRLTAALAALEGTEAGQRGLLELLADPQPDVRAYAAQSLGRAGAMDAIPALCQALGDEAANVRSHAIESLGQMRAEAAVDALLALLGENDFFIAFSCVEALGRIGTPRALPILMDRLQDDLLGDAAALALGRIADPHAVPALLQGLQRESTVATSLVALALIDGVQGRDVVSHLSETLAHTAVQQWTGSVDPGPLQAVGRAAHWLTERSEWTPVRHEALCLLARLVGREEAESVCASALVLAGADALKIVLQRLEQVDSDAHRPLLAVIRRLGDSSAIPALLPWLQSDNAETVSMVLLALDGCGCAMNPILDCLAHETPMVRHTASQILARRVGPELQRILLQHWPSATGEEREAILRLLAAGDDALTYLYRAMDATDVKLQRLAIELLGLRSATDTQVAERLCAWLESPHLELRAAAARALGHATGEAVATRLRQAMRDPDGWTRAGAVRSLAVAGRADDLAGVAALLNDPLPYVRAAACQALGRLGPGAEPYLVQAAQDGEADVVLAARLALETVQRRFAADEA